MQQNSDPNSKIFAQSHPDDPAEVFRKVNDRLFEDSRADQFVTVFYGVLEPPSGHFEYCNAGHNPPFLLHADHNFKHEILSRTGVAFGDMEGLTWKTTFTSLGEGDILLLYTDGVVEAQNKNEDFFGDARLVGLTGVHDKSAEEMQTYIIGNIKSFIGEADQFDDITLLALKRE